MRIRGNPKLLIRGEVLGQRGDGLTSSEWPDLLLRELGMNRDWIDWEKVP